MPPFFIEYPKLIHLRMPSGSIPPPSSAVTFRTSQLNSATYITLSIHIYLERAKLNFCLATAFCQPSHMWPHYKPASEHLYQGIENHKHQNRKIEDGLSTEILLGFKELYQIKI